MNIESEKEFNETLIKFERIARQLAAIFGTDSEAAKAVAIFDEKIENGEDVVILFDEANWIIGPKPSWIDFLKE